VLWILRFQGSFSAAPTGEFEDLRRREAQESDGEHLQRPHGLPEGVHQVARFGEVPEGENILQGFLHKSLDDGDHPEDEVTAARTVEGGEVRPT
jgi:hypothetical protein